MTLAFTSFKKGENIFQNWRQKTYTYKQIVGQKFSKVIKQIRYIYGENFPGYIYNTTLKANTPRIYLRP